MQMHVWSTSAMSGTLHFSPGCGWCSILSSTCLSVYYLTGSLRFLVCLFTARRPLPSGLFIVPLARFILDNFLQSVIQTERASRTTLASRQLSTELRFVEEGRRTTSRRAIVTSALPVDVSDVAVAGAVPLTIFLLVRIGVYFRLQVI